MFISFQKSVTPSKSCLKGIQTSPNTDASRDLISDQIEALKIKNAVYCAIVLNEVLKELAAISQEHTVLCL